ncbi:hypothetical protein AF72_11535 [Xylella taiwanensis]|uniref:Uncharacterized protein n=1 Tax=Xylella taiwanensis TaxID=1444770 RepID=Z9JHS9_9GAMM|nr:hypothetical protein AF72_11535 [Xylella taiwanensis]
MDGSHTWDVAAFTEGIALMAHNRRVDRGMLDFHLFCYDMPEQRPDTVSLIS